MCNSKEKTGLISILPAACSNRSRKARRPFASRDISATHRRATAFWLYTIRRPTTCANASIDNLLEFGRRFGFSPSSKAATNAALQKNQSIVLQYLHGCADSGSERTDQALRDHTGPGRCFLSSFRRGIVWPSGPKRRWQDHAFVHRLLFVGTDGGIGSITWTTLEPK